MSKVAFRHHTNWSIHMLEKFPSLTAHSPSTVLIMVWDFLGAAPIFFSPSTLDHEAFLLAQSVDAFVSPRVEGSASVILLLPSIGSKGQAIKSKCCHSEWELRYFSKP